MINDEYIYIDKRGGTQGPNTTTKWIHGFPHPRLYHTNFGSIDGQDGHLIWRDIPQLTALNCKPIIESSTAKVTVDRSDGSVQSFQILEEPTPIRRPAWNDSYYSLGFVDPNPEPGALQRTATSYGYLFLDAMLLAADLTTLQGVDILGYPDYEPLVDRTFNFRTPGLNMDFMTYAMYSLVGNDLEALLDPDVQAETANKVFGTFFQHFVSSNVTDQGSWAYQPVNNGPTIEATVARRVEMLQMSLAATAVCLSILGFFILITIIVYFVDYKHFANLQHDVDSIADVLRLVCDSPKFLAWLSQSPPSDRNSPGRTASMPARVDLPWFTIGKAVRTGQASESDESKVKLDTFMGTDGQMKWIVEIVDAHRPVPRNQRQDR